MNNPYLLTQEAQVHLKHANTSLWQSYCLLEAVQQSCTNDNADLFTALSGILALMDDGLTHLGEV